MACISLLSIFFGSCCLAHLVEGRTLIKLNIKNFSRKEELNVFKVTTEPENEVPEAAAMLAKNEETSDTALYPGASLSDMIKKDFTKAENEENMLPTKASSAFAFAPNLAMESKSRRRRSFGGKSKCYPKLIKKCTLFTYNGVTKRFCLFVYQKQDCYALD